jgi:hypothetical protein
MKGWEICGYERLGMDIVGRLESPLYGSIPVPRVLQNQLDHLLEAEIAKTERVSSEEPPKSHQGIEPLCLGHHFPRNCHHIARHGAGCLEIVVLG